MSDGKTVRGQLINDFCAKWTPIPTGVIPNEMRRELVYLLAAERAQDSLGAIMAEHAAWADPIFGDWPTGEREDQQIRHIREELDEFDKARPDEQACAEEGVDIILILMHWFSQRQLDLGALLRAKMEKNKRRRWVPAPDGKGGLRHEPGHED